jgi:hypothetical protein
MKTGEEGLTHKQFNGWGHAIQIDIALFKLARVVSGIVHLHRE